jgi:hypothetical protein
MEQLMGNKQSRRGFLSNVGMWGLGIFLLAAGAGNLAGSNPKKAQELLKQLEKWRKETGAPMITKKR